jgi:hypothetical protein
MALKFKATQHTAKSGELTYFVSASGEMWIASVVGPGASELLSGERVPYACVMLPGRFSSPGKAFAACNEYERGQKASASDVTQELTKVAV